MTAITVLYFLVFTFKCLCGEDVEMQVSTESVNQNDQINGTAGPVSTTEMYSETTNESEQNCTLTKHESYCDCPEFVGLIPEDYTMINGTAHVSALNMTYNESFYEFQQGYLFICPPGSESNEPRDSEKGGNDAALFYITVIGLTVSLLGLLLHLVSFVLVLNMRNMPGTCLASLCASMLFGYLSFLVGSADGIRSVRSACIASASVSHFFILSSLLWMNVKSFSIYMALYHCTTNLIRAPTSFTCKKFCKFSVYAWGISSLFTVAALICDNVEDVPIAYQPLFARRSCWFNQLPAIWVFFMGPAFVIIGINVIFFGLSVRTICSNRMKADDDSQRSQTETYFVTYSKLALIMGVLWLSGILARITDNIVLWYIFALSNALQGFFIFLAFTCSNLKKYLTEKLKLKMTTKGLPNAVWNVTASTNISMEETSRRPSDEC